YEFGYLLIFYSDKKYKFILYNFLKKELLMNSMFINNIRLLHTKLESDKSSHFDNLLNHNNGLIFELTKKIFSLNKLKRMNESNNHLYKCIFENPFFYQLYLNLLKKLDDSQANINENSILDVGSDKKIPNEKKLSNESFTVAFDNFADCNFVNYPNPFQSEQVNRNKANVLVVDDDVDSLIPIEQTLQNLSCTTYYAIDSKDASRKLLSDKLDLVILDWMVCDDTGAKIIENSIKKIERFNDLKEKIVLKKPKIITYSSLNEDKVKIPKSDYFEHVGHWTKPMNYKEIVQKASYVLKELGF
ncbi:MAG: hypothetical protein KDK36_17975, partial [Leptospiraceae bacterium]|nr:hypothetical protein [Leptospiraceae bacterium]